MAASKTPKSRKPKPSKPKNELADVEAADSTAGPLALADEFSDFDGLGFENIGHEDVNRPFLYLLQGGSPVVKEGLNDEVRAGHYYNTLSGKSWGKQGVIVQVIGRVQHMVAWRTRDSGGGYVGSYSMTDPRVLKAIAANGGKINKTLTMPSEVEGEADNTLSWSYDLYLVPLAEDGLSPEDGMLVCFPCTSTKIKMAKGLMSKMAQATVPGGPRGKIKVPMFAMRALLTSELCKNGSDSWFEPRVQPFGGGDSWVDNLILPSKEPELFGFGRDQLSKFEQAYGSDTAAAVDDQYKGQVDPSSSFDTSGTSVEDGVGDEDLPF